jgi:hypothetical protein
LLKVNNSAKILDAFIKNIAPDVEKIHVFYTLFSKQRLAEVKVFGRMARREKKKLSEPTRTYEQLITEHTLHAFPVICAWRLLSHMKVGTIEFHLDAFGGRICEAYEELIDSKHKITVYPGGDCVNPVIATADLLLQALDSRLRNAKMRLLFDNIRPMMQEFGAQLLVYPIHNKYLPKITPVDDKPIDPYTHIKHPVFWVFKGEEIIDSGILKRSPAFRSLQDCAAGAEAVVKLFEKQKDIENHKEGDYGVYLNKRGEDQINSYNQINKRFKKMPFETMAPKE